jgi:hypothetical protein
MLSPQARAGFGAPLLPVARTTLLVTGHKAPGTRNPLPATNRSDAHELGQKTSPVGNLLPIDLAGLIGVRSMAGEKQSCLL